MNDYETKTSEFCNLLPDNIWQALVAAGAPVYQMEHLEDGEWVRHEGGAAVEITDGYLLFKGDDGDVHVLSPEEIEEAFGDEIRWCRWEGQDGPPPLEPHVDHTKPFGD